MAIIAGIVASSCKDDFSSPQTLPVNSITSWAKSTDSLKAFYAALSVTKLADNFNNVNGGNFTVFAPSNYAFVKYLRSLGISIAKVTPATAGDVAAAAIYTAAATTSFTTGSSGLTAKLNYHIISSSLLPSQITGGQVFVTMQGARLSLSTMTVTVNNTTTTTYLLNANQSYNSGKSFLGANLIAFSGTSSDIAKSTSNGVLYLADEVMAPVGLSGTPSFASISAFLNLSVDYTKLTTDPAFITITKTSTNYDVIANAMKKTQVIATIVPNTSPLPDYTLFVPDDASFVAYLKATYAPGIVTETDAINFINGLNDQSTPTVAELTDLLNYHVVTGRLLSLDLSATQPTWLTGHSLTYSLANVTIQGDGNASPIAISAKDQLTNAGIIHVIAGVLAHD
ncbi:MAG: fasciclin domain-containing protein [Cyclobacteriaceae bacterium]